MKLKLRSNNLLPSPCKIKTMALAIKIYTKADIKDF